MSAIEAVFSANSGHKSIALYAKMVRNAGQQIVCFLESKRIMNVSKSIFERIGIMKYTYRLYNSKVRTTVDLRNFRQEIVDAILTVFDNITITVNKDTVEIDLPEPPYHIDLSTMGCALMNTSLGSYTVGKNLRKTIKGSNVKTRSGAKGTLFTLYDEGFRKCVDLRNFKKDITDYVLEVNPSAQVGVYRDHFTVFSLNRSERNALGRKIAKSSLNTYTVTLPQLRLMERVK